MPTPVTTVAQAIVAKFAASPTLFAAVAGNLWTGEVPENTNLPYAWLDTPYAGSIYTFETEFIPVRAIIHVLAFGAQAVEVLAQKFKDVFDGADLPFTDRDTIWCLPKSYKLLPETVRSLEGTLLFRVILTYDIFLERDR